MDETSIGVEPAEPKGKGPLAEFDFRYSNRIALGINDVARADHALKGIVGKRLTYQTARGQA